MRKKLKWSVWIGLFIATFILIIGGNPLSTKGSDRRSHSSQGTEHIRDDSDSQRDLPPSKLPRPAKNSPFAVSSTLEPSPNFPNPAKHTVEDLKDFYIPALQLKNTNLRAALKELFQQYNDVCAITNHAPLSFSITIEDSSGLLFDLDLTSVRFTSALKAIAAQAGVALQVEDTKLIFRELSLVREDSGDLLSKNWTVPPTFLADLQSAIGSREAGTDTSPLELLQRLGIVRTDSDELSASYLSGTSSLVLRGSPQDLARVDELIADMGSRKPTLMNTQTKIIESAEAHPDISTNRSLSSGEFVDLLHKLAQSKDANILTMPSVVTRSGQMANVEVIREHGSADDWSGVRIDTNTSNYGFGLTTNTNFDVRPAPNSQAEGISQLSARDSTTVDDILPDNQTLIRHVESPDGTHLYYFITPQIIDAAGQPISSQTSANP